MKQFEVIVFDLDSTLVSIEGLDWLAERSGKKELVEFLTKKSMEGKMPFHLALEQKLEMIMPSYNDLLKLGRHYIHTLMPGAKDAVKALQNAGKEVWIVTGNFQPAVGILAKALGIPNENVACNTIYFDGSGHYTSFASGHPLANNGGKAKVITEQIKKGRSVAFIGDAATDLEAQNVVALFIGFGGVVEREIVKKQANIYITEPNLKAVLPYILE